MRKHCKLSLLILSIATLTWGPSAFGQVAGLGLNPSRVEINLYPGQEKTVSFDIEAPGSTESVRGQLLLSLADWDISENGAITYVDRATLAESASSWATFTPAATTIVSGQKQRVRVTLRVPEDTKPGVYRSAILVQERPPATPPKRGEHFVYLRFRYVYTIYLIVGPVATRAELADVRFSRDGDVDGLVYELKNMGSVHVRPLITWSVRGGDGKSVASGVRLEAMVLLPGKTLKQIVPLGSIPPGSYEVFSEVNFQDGGPIQTMRRPITVTPTEPPVSD